MYCITPDEESFTAEFFFGRFHPEDRAIAEQDYAKAGLTKANYESDFRIVLPDGSIKNIHTIGHPLLNDIVVISFQGIKRRAYLLIRWAFSVI